MTIDSGTPKVVFAFDLRVGQILCKFCQVRVLHALKICPLFQTRGIIPRGLSCPELNVWIPG